MIWVIVVLDSTVGNNIATTFKEVFFPRESNQKSFLTLMTTTTENVGKSLVVNNSPIQVLFDGVGVEIIKVESQQRRNRSRKNQKVSIFFQFRFWLCRSRSSENQTVGVGSRRGTINQSQCTFSRFVIGFVLPLLFETPTT